MINDTDDVTSYYIGEVRAFLSACRHYLDKVKSVQTSDAHERARHSVNLSWQAERCEAWCNSGHTDAEEEWKKVRRLENDTSFLVGQAAIWLQEIAISNARL